MQSLATVIKSFVPKFGPFRRRFKRYKRVTFVLVQPLDEDLRPNGPMSWGMTTDISKRGIGLATEKFVHSNYVQVHIREDSISLFAEVRHRGLVCIPGERLCHKVGAKILGDSDHRYRMGLY